MTRIKEIFKNLVISLGNSQEVASEKWNVISQEYNSINRFYHNLNHLESILVKLNEQKDDIQDWNSIIFGLVYHDIVYDSSKSDNEELSAVFARQELSSLNVNDEQIQKVEELIISTKFHSSSPNNDINIFLDADLSILGTGKNTYDTYSKNVRLEFIQYPSYLYNQGRIKVLEYFLSRDNIYITDYYKVHYEQTAIENLNRELNRLKNVNYELTETNKNEFIIYLELDGDLSEFFYNSAKILDQKGGVHKISYYPGWFDSGYYRFIYKGTNLHLEYDGMLGTLLRTEANPSEKDKTNATEVFKSLTEVQMNQEDLERVREFYNDKNTANRVDNSNQN